MAGKIVSVFLIFITFILPSTVSLTDAPALTELPKERLASYLSERQWEILDPDTPMRGSIRGFASDSPERCAIWLENRVYLLHGAKTTACFRINLSNASRLFFLDNQLGLYEDRGLFILLIDLDTYDTTLFVMQIEDGDSRQWGLSNRFAALVSDPTNGGDGYYVRNKLWIDFLSIRYDSLTLRVNGIETVLYATNSRVVYLALFVLINVISLIILLYKIRKNKHKSRRMQLP